MSNEAEALLKELGVTAEQRKAFQEKVEKNLAKYDATKEEMIKLHNLSIKKGKLTKEEKIELRELRIKVTGC